MPKPETVKVGDVLWERKREQMAHVAGSRWAVRPVEIVEIDHVARRVVVKWNYNAPRRWPYDNLRKLTRRDPRTPKPAAAPSQGTGEGETR